MFYDLLAHPEVSDDLGEFLFNYFGDKKQIHIPKTTSDENFKVFVKLCRLGLVAIECTLNKRHRKRDFKDNGAIILLTENGKYELGLYEKDLKKFLLIKADSKKRELQAQI